MHTGSVARRANPGTTLTHPLFASRPLEHMRNEHEHVLTAERGLLAQQHSANDQHPWVLDDEARRRVERAVIPCPIGGRFRFDALPRCPHCQAELPEHASDPAHFVILADLLDGDAANIWSSEASA
jgi:hypothetical protein